MIEKDNPKIVRAWKFYDWANSVYSLVITSAIFPIYYNAITLAKEDNPILVMGFKPESIFSASLAFSFLIIIIISPILSSIADVVGNKKRFLQVFCYLGALSCMGLFFFTSHETLFLGLGLHILASIGFWGSLVFYNSYLPEIVSNKNMDKTSAQGFIYGYIGSVLLLVICLMMIMLLPQNEAETSFYTRLSFLLTGLWWIGFAQYTFYHLPNTKTGNKIQKNVVFKGFKELQKVYHQLFSIPRLKIFLRSFFFYSLGIQTIFLMAASFGEIEVKLETTELIITILLLQLEAILGAWLFEKLSSKYGNKRALLFAISIWVIVCFLAYMLDSQHPHVKIFFYVIAGMVGFVMGGIQALSRSTYGKMLPQTDDPTTFFSFYDIFEKSALFVGLVLFFVFTEHAGGMKTAVLVMGFSFIIAFVILNSLKWKTE